MQVLMGQLEVEGDEVGKTVTCFEKDMLARKGHLEYPLAFCHPMKMEIYCGF